MEGAGFLLVLAAARLLVATVDIVDGDFDAARSREALLKTVYGLVEQTAFVLVLPDLALLLQRTARDCMQ